MDLQHSSPQPISLEDVWDFLKHNDLACEDLAALGKEIDRLYSLKSGALAQTFPFELWLLIFDQVEKHYPPTHAELAFWVSARTVSKGWYSTISYQMDFSNILDETGWTSLRFLNWPRLLRTFNFSSLAIESGPIDITYLNNTKSLEAYHDSFFLRQHSQLSTLTQLTSLEIHEKAMPNQILLQLTSLEKLILDDPAIEDISRLTKLQELTLNTDTNPKITQEYCLRHLPKLRQINHEEPSFFRTGKGCCFINRRLEYVGEWLDGMRHGFGTCIEGEDFQYAGQWYKNKMQGKGTMKWLCGVIYEGDWRDSKMTGEGKMTYQNGDVYEGSWVGGKRDGPGRYLFKDETPKLDGVWEEDWFWWPLDDPRKDKFDKYVFEPLPELSPDWS